MSKAKALYIHIPFCTYLCNYCDFTKLQYFSKFVIPYLNELKKEIEHYHVEEIDTIYVGGGTPTSLSLDELKTLLEIIKPYSKGVKEYTFEANPDTLTVDKLSLLKDYGVNRLSIGVESTDSNTLKACNRHHTFLDAKEAINNARKVGFNNINVDIILGLQENIEKVKEDIMNIVSLDVEHISCYSLTVHEHTKFYMDGRKDLDDDIARNYYDLVSSILKEKGYIHYEISNFAKKGHHSLHNLTYWKDEEYFGLGLGASGYLDNVRYTNTKSITKYLKGEYKDYEEVVSKEDDKEYFIMLNLRTIFGLSLSTYQNRFQEDLYKKKKNEIDELIQNGYLIKENDTLIPTYEGMMTLDSIVLKLID